MPGAARSPRGWSRRPSGALIGGGGGICRSRSSSRGGVRARSLLGVGLSAKSFRATSRVPAAAYEFFFLRDHSALCLGSLLAKLAEKLRKEGTLLFGCLMVTALPSYSSAASW